MAITREDFENGTSFSAGEKEVTLYYKPRTKILTRSKGWQYLYYEVQDIDNEGFSIKTSELLNERGTQRYEFAQFSLLKNN